MKTFSNNLDDLIKIESIILACYGLNGKSVLIQPDKSANSSFLLTNDATTILNSIEIKSNHLYYLISRIIKDFNQDGVKSLYIYLVTASRIALKPGAETISLQDYKLAFRQLSMAKLVNELFNQWNHIVDTNENLIKLTEINHVLYYFKKMCVFYNLEVFNSNLSRISQKLLSDFLEFKLKNDETNFSQCENIIQQSLNDFPLLVEYCDDWDLEQSRIYKNHFLIDRKFTYCAKDLSNHVINSIFVLKEQNLKVDIEINTDTNIVLDKLKQENSQIQFSKDFLAKLREKAVNLIFFEGFLSESKKIQLKLIGCSFIDYVSKERIEFLTTRLGIDPIESQKNNLDDSSILKLDCFEILKENLITFKISKQTNLSFILFSSHLKINYVNFRIYFEKCLTSLAKLVSTKSEFCCVLVKSYYFEHKCLDLVSKIVSVESYNDVLLKAVKNFLRQMFQYVLLKFKKFKNLRQLFEYEFNENAYEVLSLKFDCLTRCIYFMQSLLNIDSIHFINQNKI